MSIGMVAPPTDRDPRCEEWPPEPAWVAEAHRESIWAALAGATSGAVGRDALTLLAELDAEQLASQAQAADRTDLHRASARRESHGDERTGSRVRRGEISEDACDVVDGESGTNESSRPRVSRTETARVLLDGIVLAQRIVNHVQAVQQRLIAALSRPGVAVPLADLVDLAGTDLTDALADAVDAVDAVAAEAVDRAASGATDPGTAAPGGDPQAALAHPVHGPAIREAAVKAAAAEIGCALHLAPITARMRCETALEMVDALPATIAAQHRGDIDGFRARLIAERTSVLPQPLRRHVERRVLPQANCRTAAGLRRLIDREVIAADPAAAQRRVETARQERTVIARRGEDDMGILTAIVPAPDSETAYAVLDSIAAQLSGAGLAEGRSRDQLRADAFTDLFRTLADTGCVHLTAMCRAGEADSQPAGGRDSDPTPAGAAPAAGFGFAARTLPCGPADTVVSVRRPVALNVYLDAATLAKLNNLPGELAGYGAITADTAHALAASADTIRAILVRPVGVDPGPGADGAGRRTCDTILDAGRAIYRPPDATADYVTSRDRTCTFPGCRAPAQRCDLDHRTPFHSGGETCPHNLDALCRSHHRLKTFTTWRATRDPATDRLAWTSPLGHAHFAEPAHLLRGGPPAEDDAPPF